LKVTFRAGLSDALAATANSNNNQSMYIVNLEFFIGLLLHRAGSCVL
jgi:hypothetical protein